MLSWLPHRQTIPESGAVGAPQLTPQEIAELIEQARAHTQRRQQRHEVHQRHPGDSRSVHMGRGLDFEESRPYQPGDDIRDMDWRTTARIGKPYLKVYREEHHPMLHLVIDRGASMRFGTRVRLKATQAARVTALLAIASSRDCACVGGTLVEESAASLLCQPGDTGALAVAEAAAAPCPPIIDTGDTAARWRALLPRLIAEIPRGSRLIFVTDLHWLREEHASALNLLASRQEVAVCEIADPAELTLPDVGLARFRDTASGATRWIDTASRGVRAAFQRETETRRQARALLLRRAGIANIAIGTDEDALARIAEWSLHA
jgi:uncharacterized protein (DUF58 family)